MARRKRTRRRRMCRTGRTDMRESKFCKTLMYLSLGVVLFTFNPDTSTLNSGRFWQPWSVPCYSEMWTKRDRTSAVVSAIVNYWLKGSNSNKNNLFRLKCVTGTVDKILIQSLLGTIEVPMGGCWNTLILGKKQCSTLFTSSFTNHQENQ